MDFVFKKYDTTPEGSNNLKEINHDYLVKIILVGDMGVGKTSIISKYIKGIFPNNPLPTIAVEYCSKLVLLKDGKYMKAQIWDTTGQEKYKSITSQNTYGAVIVYDITRRSSFQSCKRFLLELLQFLPQNSFIFIIGNKLDIVESSPELRQVSFEEAEIFAKTYKLELFETSAFSNKNVTEFFDNMIEIIYEKNKMLLEEKRLESLSEVVRFENESSSKKNYFCCKQ